MMRVLLLVLTMACATTRTSAPARELPPPEAWPACVAFCEAHDAPYLGIVIPDPDGKRFGCGCGQRPAPAPQAWR